MLATYGLQRSQRTLPWYADTSNLNRAVTLNGSVSQSNDGAGVRTALFDGTASYLRTTPIGLGTGNFTLELFVNHSSADPNIGVFMNGGDLGLQFGYENTASVVYLGLANIVNTIYQSASINDSWHHIAYVKTGTVGKMYLDGTSIATATDNNNYPKASIDIGAFVAFGAGNGYFKGKMAGLRITSFSVYTSNFSTPTILPTAIAGTQLLMNFGATAAPTV